MSVSEVSVLSVSEQIRAVEFYARQLVTRSFETPIIYSMTALLYLAMCLPMGRLVARLERRSKAWR